MDYGIALSPMEGRCLYQGMNIRYFNQIHKGWTHPYEYEHNGSDLHDAGCGVFSMAVVIQRLSGQEVDPNALADFSCACGGRGDDGTDRPELLSGMVRAGKDQEYGFRYDGDGLVNDHALLWKVLSEGGCAMCNLRVGHIVAVIDCREVNGEKQMLVVDSACESSDRRVRDSVREILPESAVTYLVHNGDGLACGLSISHSVYWVALDTAKDFNLIWKR